MEAGLDDALSSFWDSAGGAALTGLLQETQPSPAVTSGPAACQAPPWIVDAHITYGGSGRAGVCKPLRRGNQPS